MKYVLFIVFFSFFKTFVFGQTYIASDCTISDFSETVLKLEKVSKKLPFRKKRVETLELKIGEDKREFGFNSTLRDNTPLKNGHQYLVKKSSSLSRCQVMATSDLMVTNCLGAPMQNLEIGTTSYTFIFDDERWETGHLHYRYTPDESIAEARASIEFSCDLEEVDTEK